MAEVLRGQVDKDIRRQIGNGEVHGLLAVRRTSKHRSKFFVLAVLCGERQ